mmetsp:Transcript_39789/g.127485  ORF Transcript_39789/g.127485 Transcript_39789/m.127485 type:complete len:311 (+) Transcript_39789:71-1003(+)
MGDSSYRPRRQRSRSCRAAAIAVGAGAAVGAMAFTRSGRHGCWAPPPAADGVYRFRAARASLQLCVVPVPGPARSGIPGAVPLPEGLQSLSLFGWTIGGSFFVDWEDSPWGPYREVGLLSCLAIATSAAALASGAWGAWASHVWVDSKDATEGGRRLYGLPATTCTIAAEEASLDGSVLAFGRAPLLHINDGVGPLGRIDTPPRLMVGLLPRASRAEGELPWPLPSDLTLPNLSGGLREADPQDVEVGFDCRRLLSYPMRLRPGGASFLPGHAPTGGNGVVPRLDFSAWLPLFGVELLDVEIEVGVPEAL